jgi:hypothetical protein
MFETRRHLIDELTAAGLRHYAEEIGKLAQPCLHFAAASTKSRDAGRGAVKLGGSPELPESMRWPYRPALPHADAFRAWLRDDHMADVWSTPRPLTFFAQVDLAAAAVAYDGTWPLPPRGRLYFFWDSLCGCYGQGVANARVVLDSSDARLVPLDHPTLDYPHDVAGLPPIIPARHFDLKLAWSCPDQSTLKWLIPDGELRELLGAKLFQELYWRRIQAWSLKDSPHRMLGWCTPIQDEPAIDAAAEVAGVMDVPMKWPTRETLQPLLPSMTDWLLLLQVELADAYQDKGVEGMVYFMVPRKDAQAGRFDRVTAVYQQT